ncbi:iron-sulfur cluster co-chaperone protein HscB [Hemiscyllium ocellatum]|uniref:iron-sulfur cluster co-chaperone protein HscB n=1 Tax=Hemiscyllium ocellatum TaxID=170820 RepID=UPI00296712EA|nr:iron-sulfur cluster co-chaperone protein HscB [Hemiscyllium ocellatum]
MLRGLLRRVAPTVTLRVEAPSPRVLSPGTPLSSRALRPPSWAAACPLLPAGRRAFCSGPSGCWRCGAERASGAEEAVAAFFCPSCRALQPPDRRRDYFQLLGLQRRYRLDAEQLRRSVRRLQRELHPDNFSRGSEDERRFSEEQSALVNEAYGTLLRPLSRGVYLLRLELPGEAGLGEEPESGQADSGEDPTFLAAVLRLNERLEEARGPEEIGQVSEEVEARLRELDAEVARAFEGGRPRDALPLLKQMRYWSSLGDRIKERLLPR